MSNDTFQYPFSYRLYWHSTECFFYPYSGDFVTQDINVCWRIWQMVLQYPIMMHTDLLFFLLYYVASLYPYSSELPHWHLPGNRQIVPVPVYWGCFTNVSWALPKYSLEICVLQKSYLLRGFQAETLYVCPKSCFWCTYIVSAWNYLHIYDFWQWIYLRDYIRVLHCYGRIIYMNPSRIMIQPQQVNVHISWIYCLSNANALDIQHLALSHQYSYVNIINETLYIICHHRGHYLDYYPCAIFLTKITATHLKTGHP